MRAFAELHETRDRIAVHFPYDPQAVKLIKTVGGRSFVPKEKGGPFWTVPLNLEAARRLREAFGDGLQLGDGLRAWGHDQVQRERNLSGLSIADDADLDVLPGANPLIWDIIEGKRIPGYRKDHPLGRKRKPRKYQRADIKMMSLANVLNANQPGTGKTIEVIGAVIESGKLDAGPHLVSAPVRSLENVWAAELERQGLPVFTAEQPAERKRVVAEGLKLALAGQPCWIVVNPDMLRVKKITKESEEDLTVAKDHKGNRYKYGSELQEGLSNVDWETVTVDEFHKTGLNNRLTLFSVGLKMLKSQRRFALSGTPMGGKPRRLWHVLHWLEPEEYKAEWTWIDNWLEKDDNGFGVKVGGIVPHREEDFYRSHAKHMVRRMKREALPGLPPKQRIVVTCKMTAGQRKQYEKFKKESEIKIGKEKLVATNVLAEYARLKQFANAKCTIETLERIESDEAGHATMVVPTMDSGKLPQLLQKLDEHGIRKTDPEPGARAIVASESKRMVKLTVEYLRGEGIEAEALTGETKDSRPMIKRFQEGDDVPFVLVMTTTTGGVSLNLERANSVHILDETWNPDDQEQLEDRGDRGSRETPLMCYYYRTADTIQDYIASTTEGKAVTNSTALDLHRKLLRAGAGAS